MSPRRRVLGFCALALFAFFGRTFAQTPPASPRAVFNPAGDVHAKKGLTCESCHGASAPAPGQIKAADIAPMCATCHAKALPKWKDSVHAAALARGDSSAPTCSTCHVPHGLRPLKDTPAQAICGQCHVREAELYAASPKQKIFAETDHPACVTCHEEHKIVMPTDDWVSMKANDAPCTTCHDSSMKGASVIVSVRQHLQKLADGIDRADQVLDRAERAGMLVDDGRLAVRDAREKQILARLNVHAFAIAPFEPIAAQGLASAQSAERVGAGALAELQYRRRGLGVATLLILGFLVTLGLKIRRLPAISDQSSR
jgi:predicted CXXCH cytochrome family protein